MRRLSFIKTRTLLIGFIVCLMSDAAIVHADTIGLSDGRYLEGELIEESATHVTFRHVVAGRWMNVQFRRAQIDVIDVQVGDQSDGYKASTAAPSETARFGGAESR